MRLFALNASREFGERVAAALGRPLDAHEEREFVDGEHKARPLLSVRGETVYVLQSLHGDALAELARGVQCKEPHPLFPCRSMQPS